MNRITEADKVASKIYEQAGIVGLKRARNNLRGDKYKQLRLSCFALLVDNGAYDTTKNATQGSGWREYQKRPRHLGARQNIRKGYIEATETYNCLLDLRKKYRQKELVKRGIGLSTIKNLMHRCQENVKISEAKAVKAVWEAEYGE